MKWEKGARLSLVITTEFLCPFFTLNSNAQMRTKTTTTTGKPNQQVKVDRAEVLLVAGNDLVLKLPDGTIRHIANVPETFRATVDGQKSVFTTQGRHGTRKNYHHNDHSHSSDNSADGER